MRDPSLTCPHCGSDYVLRLPRRAIERPFLYLFHSIPYRCGPCQRRFYRRQKENNSSVSSTASARPPRGPHLEETFSLTLPAHAEVPLEPGISDATGVQAAGRSAASAGIPRRDVAYSFRRNRLGPYFKRYWGDVSYSFRCDLRTFYSDCRRFLAR